MSGYDAPAPSQSMVVHWALHQAKQNVPLADAYKALNTPAFKRFADSSRNIIAGLPQ
ncbi:hypothetical protein [Aridibaculum aurantiacum]|uniref:hypothetical protein n=1 Tax=Aridibaculum aurantiacum TaxID=2810307 RepID=UPI001A96CA21|nr:hypothetical protein [Aridibaculum aurantiacum]